MVTIVNLLEEEMFLVDKIYELSLENLKAKQVREEKENELWITTDFKAHGATNEKQRKALVSKTMAQIFPPIHIDVDIQKLQNRLKFVRHCIDVMRDLGVDSIELEGFELGKNTNKE